MREITFRLLKQNELIRIKEIDRTENIFEYYEYKDGELIIKSVHDLVNSFDEAELQEMIQRQHLLIANGGKVIAAFSDDKLIGVASVERKRRGKKQHYCKMDILYVSNSYRGNKIGHQLVRKCVKIATTFGAEKLYISATPTKATVDFYLKEGASLVEEIDEELFELEPFDIHLELKVN
ncbi:GNAT family N-acetyltransferase [Pedobacter chitinilyticus]|uniref:GNAT family N-acetyltransferase n=2 Tax=Pedobacter chitinilyticus TaxID=2233776 RepID=A0A3S3SU06_9SPHI|nr:GNAT family N-acetyltransferase [Pedobacter chitinilyticus]RWU10339.1 GNAT family N-acetyltransferase [Pedobacter chitinilyticus]